MSAASNLPRAASSSPAFFSPALSSLPRGLFRAEQAVGRRLTSRTLPGIPNVWVGINSDGSVIIVSHRSEMGTGIRTSLPMVLADELEADWTRVRLQQAIGSERYGSQDTDGSVFDSRFLRNHA